MRSAKRQGSYPTSNKKMSPLLAFLMTLSGGIGGMQPVYASLISDFSYGYPIQVAATPTDSYSVLFGQPLPNEAPLPLADTTPVYAPHSPAHTQQARSQPLHQYDDGMPTQRQAPVQTQRQTPPQNIVAPAANTFASQVEADVLADTNAQREQNGLPALAANATLASVASAHSADMLANKYFSHTDRQGCDAACRITNAGYSWQDAGENIHMMSGYQLDAAGAAQKIVTDFMNSPEHRANILNTSYEDIGIGVAVSGDTVYTTQDFGKAR